MDYTGYITITDETNISDIYAGNYNIEQLKENEYVILEDKNGKPIDYFRCEDKELIKIKYPVIESKYEGSIKPKNPQQLCAMDLLLNNKSKVKVLRGVYGSGKDFLMLHAALELLDKGYFEKIVYVRPNITVGGLPDIGALPGGIESKLAWTLAPLYDKVGGEDGVNYLIDCGKLEMIPMGFIRGRSFNNSIIYMTEGQNMSVEIAKLLIGRVGQGSELWINADNHQVDKRLFEQDNGITRMVDKLSGHPLFGYMYMPITERSDVARLADILDEE